MALGRVPPALESALIRRWLSGLQLDLRSLALLRIAFGLLLLLDLAIRAGWLEAHYTDPGCQPRAAVADWSWLASFWSLHMAVGSLPAQALLFLVQGGCYVALTLGYRTRWSGALSWALLVSLHNRNPVILDGGDLYLRCLLFWLIFTPWGSTWSWDARTGPARASSGLAALGYTWQLTLIYAFAFLLKTGAPWRETGSAAMLALRVDLLATPLAPWLLEHPDLTRWLSFSVLYFEGLVPLLIWLHPWTRLLAVLGLTGMHLGLGLFLHLGVFGPIAAVSSWGLLPACCWDRLGVRRPQSEEAPPLAPAWWTQVALLYLLARITQWNVCTWQGYATAPRPADLYALRLDQKWNMFAPRPQSEDGYFVVAGETEQGDWVDAWIRPGDGPLRWDKPVHGAAWFPDARWRKLMMNLSDSSHERWRAPLLQYLARRWERSHPGHPLRALRLYYVLESTRDDGSESELTVRLLAYRGGPAPRPEEDRVSVGGAELLRSLEQRSNLIPRKGR